MRCGQGLSSPTLQASMLTDVAPIGPWDFDVLKKEGDCLRVVIEEIKEICNQV